MKLFSREKPVCAVCGREIEFNKFKLNNGECICQNCVQRVGISPGFTFDTLRALTPDEIKQRFEAAAKSKEVQKQRFSNFRPGLKFNKYIWFDDFNKWFTLPAGSKIYEDFCPIIAYEDIIDYELLEDGDSVIKGGLGGALVGGALLGVAGAIAGGTSKRSKATCTLMQIRITTKDDNNPVQMVNLLSEGEFKKNGLIYKATFQEAQQIISKLKLIVDENQRNQSPAASDSGQALSVADELLKFKQLLDMGVITEEEFATKKKQLLEM